MPSPLLSLKLRGIDLVDDGFAEPLVIGHGWSLPTHAVGGNRRSGLRWRAGCPAASGELPPRSAA